jgi:hypothetical protein
LKKLGLGLISLVAAAAMLAACGGGGGSSEPDQVASANVTAPITSSSVAAVTGESFTFSGGVSKFGTATPTTVTLDSASSFAIASNEGTASGNLGFGSCIFTVTQSTFPAGHALALGKVVTVHPCSITVATAGVTAEANATARAVSFVLEGNASVANSLTVDIADNGTVIVDGVSVGTVTLTPATGASGS